MINDRGWVRVAVILLAWQCHFEHPWVLSLGKSMPSVDFSPTVTFTVVLSRGVHRSGLFSKRPFFSYSGWGIQI